MQFRNQTRMSIAIHGLLHEALECWVFMCNIILLAIVKLCKPVSTQPCCCYRTGCDRAPTNFKPKQCSHLLKGYLRLYNLSLVLNIMWIMMALIKWLLGRILGPVFNSNTSWSCILSDRYYVVLLLLFYFGKQVPWAMG